MYMGVYFYFYFSHIFSNELDILFLLAIAQTTIQLGIDQHNWPDC